MTKVLRDENTCDAVCPAKAAADVTMPSGLVLKFCGHHTSEYEATLISQGADIKYILEVPAEEPAMAK